MRIAIGLLLASAAACGGDDGGYPVGGGGTDGGLTFPDSSGSGSNTTDGGGSGSGDGGTAADVDANIFTGRVCLATDPRKLNTCATTGADGLTVRLGNAVTTTGADGSFMIEGQPATVWRVTGPNIVSSYMLIGDYEIPAITTATYNALITNNLQGLELNPGEGSVMIQTIRNGFGQPGVTASSSPRSSWDAFYDGASATTLVQTSTGAEGMVWVPGIDVGNAVVSVNSNGESFATPSLPIFDGGITFATVILPPPAP